MLAVAKKKRAWKLLQGALAGERVHYSTWCKRQYRHGLVHWKKQDQSFLGNRAYLLVYQGLNKGYAVGTLAHGTYSTVLGMVERCYFPAGVAVNRPDQAFFLTGLFLERLEKKIEELPPKDIQERVWFYQRISIYRQFLHALVEDQEQKEEITIDKERPILRISWRSRTTNRLLSCFYWHRSCSMQQSSCSLLTDNPLLRGELDRLTLEEARWACCSGCGVPFFREINQGSHDHATV